MEGSDNVGSMSVLLKLSLFAHFFSSAERLTEDLNPSVAKMPCEPTSEVMAPKVISYRGIYIYYHE